MQRLLVATAVMLVGATTAIAEPEHGHVPDLFVSTDWGAQLLYHDNLDASGGLTATVRRPTKNAILYADARALFVGGNFGARVGVIAGPSYVVTNSDTKINSVSHRSEISGGQWRDVQVTDSTTTYFSGQTIRGVIGLALSASANTFGYGDGSNAQLEAGFGMCAQNCFELQYIQDVSNDGRGFRLAGTYSMAKRDHHVAFRYAIEGLWGDELPSFGLFTVGVGFGSGFHWKD